MKEASGTLNVHIESARGSWDHVKVRELSGREVISQLFSFDLDVVLDEGRELPPDAAPGAEVSLVFEADGEEIRRISGMLGPIRDRLEPLAERATCRLRLVPRAYRLTLVETQEIFMDCSVPDIIRSKLERHNFGAEDVELRLLESYPEREFVVQYGESDLAFISRLAEHDGIGFFFEHEGGRDRLIFTDHPAGFRPAAGAATVPFRPRGEAADIFALEVTTDLIPTSYVVQDYNYRAPQLDMTAYVGLSSGDGGGVVEYGSHVKTPEEARRIAQIRAEERLSRQRVFEGRAGRAALSAGRRVTVIDHPRLPAPEELLLVEVEHQARFPAFMDDGAQSPFYRNTFRAIPARIAYRPPRRTPRPRISGVVTGIVQPGPGGKTNGIPQLDAEGRYTVQLHFDTAQPGEQKASRPVRMAQPFGGLGHGMHFPLRPGTEVVVAFANGDPDRPVILGAMFHPLAPSPVTARNANQSRITTASGTMLEISEKR
ncbi:type VI secretion system tip protein TssI/VgrG [Sorangium sp. So ce1036]|uniref:type VI secretion system Vgr family protein n=1 Tax=Sorangium sp. So ce1036 TaxID=3133328 RepID=UPI003F106954